MPASATKHPRYAVHPGVLMVQKWVAELPEKTGRSLEQWVALGKKSGPGDPAKLREWYKAKHGLGTNAAGWIADRALGLASGEGDTPDGYLARAVEHVDVMYAGGKAGLRPVHDALIALGQSLGKDIRICPGRTIVPLYRHHVIAQIKPATQSRIDFGLALGNRKATGRLIDTGGFAKKDRITHRIEIGSVAEVDAEVMKWLRMAYDRDSA
jgi:hypothetical protein